MRAKINLEMAKELIRTAELKLEKLYEDKDSGKINAMEFAIRCAEVSGIFNGLASEASALIQDCLGLPMSESKGGTMLDQLTNMIKSASKEEVPKDEDINSLLRRRKIN